MMDHKTLSFLLIVFSLFPGMSFGQNLLVNFENQFLESPSFINVTRANYSILPLNQSFSGNYQLELQFIGSRNEIVAKKNYALNLNCSGSSEKCELTKIFLPIQLERLTCSINATFKKNNGEFIASNLGRWGSCESNNFVGHAVSDYSFSTNVLFSSTIPTVEFPYPIPNSSKVDLEIQGIQQRSLKLLLVGLGKNDEIIYHDTRTVSLGNFSINLTAYQWQNLCQLRLFLDRNFQINETDKMNNELVLEVGDCKRGDQQDLAAWIKPSFQGLSLYMINLGTLGISNKLINFSIFSFDKDHRLLNSTSRSSEVSIAGLGGFLSMDYPIINPEGCSFIFQLDNDYHLPSDQNRTNNTFELNLCH